MTPPPYPAKGMDVLEWSKKLWSYVIATRPRCGPGLTSAETTNGTLISLNALPPAAAAHPQTYPFAELLYYMEDSSPVTAIRGGVVRAGTKTWNVENHPLNLATPGEFLYWLEMSVTANTETQLTDDTPPEEVLGLIDGIADSTAPAWQSGPQEEGYPDSGSPTDDQPECTVIIPIGVVTIDDGRATFLPAYYGSLDLRFLQGEAQQVRSAFS